MRTLPRFSLLFALLAPSLAVAQQTPPSSSTPPTRVVGFVFDSVRARPLVGARVRVDTSAVVGIADDEGRFQIDDLTPGQHKLRVEHPLLDTLGIALVSPAQTYAAGTTASAVLATPSSETLISILCSPAWMSRGPAALVGRVREADTGEPATGAKVSLVWYELSVTSGIRRLPRVREQIVAANGTYRICGLPAQLDGKVQVLRGPLTSGEIAIAFGEDLLAMRSMTIAPASAIVATSPSDSGKGKSAVTVTGTARLTGRVVDKAGKPVAGARIQLEGTTRATSTRPNGEFVLDSLPPGTQSVSARRLGFAPVDEAVDLVSAEPRSITITLADFVPVLAAVRVSAQRERALDDVGFARRKRSGMGYYLDGDAINHASIYYSDVLRSVPGLRIVPAGNGRSIVTNARSVNGCVVFWIDGTMWQQMEAGDIDDFVRPHEIAAIEVYNGSAVPIEYQKSGAGSCSVVVAWTFRRLDRKR